MKAVAIGHGVLRLLQSRERASDVRANGYNGGRRLKFQSPAASTHIYTPFKGKA
ncbi:hypothetical protein MnBA_00890 [Marinobacterium sp. BA1]